MPSAWLRRKVFQPCDGGSRLLTIYLATLVCPISMPSLERTSSAIPACPFRARSGNHSITSSRQNGEVAMASLNRCMAWLRPRIAPASAGESYPRKVDELGRPAVENGLHRVHPKMIDLIQCGPGWHGKLLSSTHHVDENRSLMRQRCLDGTLQLLRLLDSDAADTHGFRHQRKVGVPEI